MKIAITGGIGSGKTTVCNLLSNQGYFIFNSDVEAKKIANTNIEIKTKIIKIFGDNSYIDGVYNTSYIRDVVFNDNSKLKQLNECFGLFLIEEYYRKVLNHKISFFESALIFEHGIQGNFDYIIGIYCEKDEVISRIKKRNGFNDTEINKIFNNQLNSYDKMKLCDYIIDTTNGIDIHKINKIIDEINQ